VPKLVFAQRVISVYDRVVLALEQWTNDDQIPMGTDWPLTVIGFRSLLGATGKVAKMF